MNKMDLWRINIWKVDIYYSEELKRHTKAIFNGKGEEITNVEFLSDNYIENIIEKHNDSILKANMESLIKNK